MADNRDMAVSVTNAADRHRFEAWVGGQLAGFASYRRDHDVTVFTHTKVEPEFEGRGVGSALARAALDEARAHDRPVRAGCPFIAAWIARHPEYQRLTEAARQRSGQTS